MSPAAPFAPRHRRDIDGLRALAIVPILLLHCGVVKLRGGFIGVDIFFVISGYLITGILTRDITEGSFTLLRFYRHRIVRILPALSVMVAIVGVLGCAVLLPNQLRDLGRSMAATSVFGSNVYFYLTTDYFAASSDTKPFIHTWSLAVEEQFYLLYPLLLLALRHLSRRHLATVLACIGGASFALGAWLVGRSPSAAFYLLPPRAWELSLGGLAALGAVPAVTSARLRAALCGAAIVVIGASCVIVSGGWPFPVPFALPAALGTLVLLAYGETGPTARLLSLAPVRAIGLLSYSLYLWHRPIITLYQIAYGATISTTGTLVLIGTSVIVATLSYALVERPAIRRWRSGTGLWPHAIAVAVLACGAVAGLMIAAHADTIRPLPPTLRRLAGFIGYDTTPAGRRQFSQDRCFTLPTGRPFEPACLLLSPDKRNIVLLGDSHAAQLSQALHTVLPDAQIVQATAAGCRPLLKGRGLPSCRAVMDRAFREVDFSHVSVVLLAARWLDFEQPQLLETIHYLRAHHVRVVVQGPMVEYDADLPMLMVQGALANDPGRAARFRRPERLMLDKQMQNIVTASGARYFSVRALECHESVCRLSTADGTPIHFDTSHLTEPAALDLVRALVSSGALSDPQISLTPRKAKPVEPQRPVTESRNPAVNGSSAAHDAVR